MINHQFMTKRESEVLLGSIQTDFHLIQAEGRKNIESQSQNLIIKVAEL